MARYTGPRARICRRLEFPAFESSKFSSIRKNYPPGQHGNGRRGKLSNYGIQLREKQRIKYLYGILEEQFRNYFKKAISKDGATGDSAARFNDTAPTSSVFSVGDHVTVNKNTINYIAYLFADKQGYSKFGSYEGNGNADGPFIYTNFPVAWVMFKNTGASQSWYIYDIKRRTFNPLNTFVKADTNQPDSTSGVNLFDVCANGIKIRGDGSVINSDGVTYVYMAFADAPFVNSKGVPCNAK